MRTLSAQFLNPSFQLVANLHLFSAILAHSDFEEISECAWRTQE